jgi:hypothetical protein
MIFKKSFIAPLLKCGIVSLTTDISKCGVLAAKSISIGRIPNVFPAECFPLAISHKGQFGSSALNYFLSGG